MFAGKIQSKLFETSSFSKNISNVNVEHLLHKKRRILILPPKVTVVVVVVVTRNRSRQTKMLGTTAAAATTLTFAKSEDVVGFEKW